VSYYLRLLDGVNDKLGHERSWYQVLAAEEEPNSARLHLG
jgi:hypothetical protein